MAVLPILAASPAKHGRQVTDLDVAAGSGPVERGCPEGRPTPRCAFVLVTEFTDSSPPRYDEKMGKSVTSANAAAPDHPGRVRGRWWPRPAAAAARPPARVPGRADLPRGPRDPTRAAAGRGRRRAGRASRHGAAPDATVRRSASPADRPAGGRWRAGPPGPDGRLGGSAGGAVGRAGLR